MITPATVKSVAQKASLGTVQDLVKQGDLAGLEKVGFSKGDANFLLAEAQKQGIAGLMRSLAFLGGAATNTAGGAASVAQFAGQVANRGALLGAVRGGTPLDGVDQGKVKDFNLKGVSLPKEITKIADATFGGRPNRIATAGYSAPPSGTAYAEHTADFLGKLADQLGTGNVGFTTRPTADKGSIDAITTMMGQEKGVPVLNITAKGYVDYIDPSKFPEGIDKAAYSEAPKYVFPDGAKYNQATALASNAFIATGGRDVTVYDFMRALEKGNPVVLVVDDSMKAPMGESAVWDAAKSRPNNGAAYLAEQIEGFLKTGELKHPPVAKDGMGSFDKEWLDDGRLLLEKLVKVVHISGPNDIEAAAAAAARHIGGFNAPSAQEALAPFHQTTVDDIKNKFQPEYQESGYKYAALTASQLADATLNVPGAAAHMGEAKRHLDEIVHLTVRHFGSGKFSMLDEASMNKAAITQHAGYVAGELSRKLGLPEKETRALLVPFYEQTAAGASPEARAKLAGDLQSLGAKHMSTGITRGEDLKGEMAAIKSFVTDDNNGWMFNQWGFGDTDKALNRPGVYAGQAVLEFAAGIAGSQAGAKALLDRALNGSPEQLAKALENPQSIEDVVAQFAARAAQAGWLVSKTGQGIVEANHADPEKAKKGLGRFAPKLDLITDFDSLAQKKGWAEVAKDIDQIKTFLSGTAGIL